MPSKLEAAVREGALQFSKDGRLHRRASASLASALRQQKRCQACNSLANCLRSSLILEASDLPRDFLTHFCICS
jgi:hypothetical protein